jgi:IclR family acetate operon transcriptional repressor
VCVAELPSAQPLSFKRGVGYREDVILGASGRVILAHLPSPESFVQPERKPFDADAFHARLEKVREQGYEVSRDELIKGAVAVAVPFFVGDDRVIGSLAVFGPGVRVDQAHVLRFAQRLKAEAKQLSQALGQRP